MESNDWRYVPPTKARVWKLSFLTFLDASTRDIYKYPYANTDLLASKERTVGYGHCHWYYSIDRGADREIFKPPIYFKDSHYYSNKNNS